MSNQTDGVDDLAALERFVIENDDLLELEALIGRFNVFDVLRLERAEIRHSNFLAWLLDPVETHGQGDLFLKAMLMDLLREARQQGFEAPISAVELDGAEIRGVAIRREWKNIDLLIVSKSPRLVVCIENKMHAHERPDKLQKYEDTVARDFTGWPTLFVFLNPDGEDASDEDWLAYSYGSLFRVLDRARRAAGSVTGSDVGVFLNHYLSLIGSRFMEDTRIKELCARIYNNHRRAIELIFEQVGSIDSPIIQMVEEILHERRASWIRFKSGDKLVDFTHQTLLEATPLSRTETTGKSWLNMNFNLWTDGALSFQVWAWGCDEPDRRLRILQRITSDRHEFDLKKLSSRGLASPSWASLGRKQIYRWDNEEEPDLDKARRAVTEQLDRWEQLMPALIAVIQQTP